MVSRTGRNMNKYLQLALKNKYSTALITASSAWAIQQAGAYLLDKFVAVIEVGHYTDTYATLTKWLTQSGVLKNRKSVRFDHRIDESYALTEGKFFTKYNGKMTLVECIKKTTQEDVFYSLRVSILGGTRVDIDSMLAEAGANVGKEKSLSIQSYDNYWYRSQTKALRPLSTFILQPGQKERIVNDMKWFIKNKEWFVQKGIPYHRGYLFYGVPGTGKTTALSVFASEVDRPICSINLSSVSDDSQLIKCLGQAPVGAIIALEDIDCIKVSNTRSDDNKKDVGVTLAGVLNALDGVQTPDGAIFILTTNDLDSLDKALIRPGRIDMVEHFEPLETDQQKELSRLFFDVDVYRNDPIPASALQSIFIKNIKNAKAAQEELDSV